MAYNPLIPAFGGNGSWTIAQEKARIETLSVRELIDCLLVKINNSNGLDFCSSPQLLALYNLIEPRCFDQD